MCRHSRCSGAVRRGHSAHAGVSRRRWLRSRTRRAGSNSFGLYAVPDVTRVGKPCDSKVIADDFDVAQMTRLPTGAIGSNAGRTLWICLPAIDARSRDSARACVCEYFLSAELTGRGPMFRVRPCAGAGGRFVARRYQRSCYCIRRHDALRTRRDFDAKVLGAMEAGDEATLTSLPEEMFQSAHRKSRTGSWPPG